MISSASTIDAKIGPGTNWNWPCLLIEHRGPRDVGWQQVRGELDPLLHSMEGLRQRSGERGLARPWQVLQEEVAFGEQAGHHQPENLRLADNRLAEVCTRRLTFASKNCACSCVAVITYPSLRFRSRTNSRN